LNFIVPSCGRGKFAVLPFVNLNKTASYVLGFWQFLLIIYTLNLQFHEIYVAELITVECLNALPHYILSPPLHTLPTITPVLLTLKWMKI
jgi:hypothetical protein